MTETARHLGGYWPGGDPASWYPHLWDWFVYEQEVGSVLDVGCGEGHALRYFRDQLGADVLGIDGVSLGERDVVVHDFTRGPVVLATGGYDLCWCCEFVEHVEERFLQRNVLPAFRATRIGGLLALTHALPGQGGHHHVHEREPTYWVDWLTSAGFKLEIDLTQDARLLAGLNIEPTNYFARTGLVFRRER